MCGLNGFFGKQKVQTPTVETTAPAATAVDTGDTGTVDAVTKKKRKRGFLSTRTAIDTALGASDSKKTLG